MGFQIFPSHLLPKEDVPKVMQEDNLGNNIEMNVVGGDENDCDDNTPSRGMIQQTDDNNDGGEQQQNIDTINDNNNASDRNNSSDQPLFMLFDADVPKRIAEKLTRIFTDLPENLRTAPNAMKQLALEIPAHASEIAENFPSTLPELHSTIITLGTSAEDILTTTITTGGNFIKDLPHRATFEWKHLMGILTIMTLSPLLGELVFFFPMNPVDDGPEANRTFIYGIMTLYQALMMLPWIETCNFAMPNVEIPVRARIVALLAGLSIAKVIDVSLTEGMFTDEPIFPIPFSILITGMLGLLPAVPIMYRMTPQSQRKKGNFFLMSVNLLAYWVALLVVIGWAIGIQRLQGKGWRQYLLLISYAFLRFICKILLCGNIASRLNWSRMMQLNFVVDILFVRVQVATLPFIDNIFTLFALFFSDSIMLLFKYFSGVDRLKLWLEVMFKTVFTTDEDSNSNDGISGDDGNGNSSRTSCIGFSSSKQRKIKDITVDCITKSNQYIIEQSPSFATIDTASVEEQSEEVEDGNTVITGSLSSIALSSIGFSDGSDYDDDDVDNDDNDIEMASSVSSIIRCTEKPNDVEGNNIPLKLHHKDDDCDDEDIEANTVASTKTENPNDDIKEENLVPAPPTPPSTSSFITITTVRGENTWEQRDLYHKVDSTGSLFINIIVRINQQLIFMAVRLLPSSQHLNESFQISNARWLNAQKFGWIYIGMILVLVIFINYSPFFRYKCCGRLKETKGNGGKKLSLGRILSYIFKDHFWYILFWLISTGALVSSAMVNHFGADFTMHFEYMDCLEQIQWPSCPS